LKKKNLRALLSLPKGKKRKKEGRGNRGKKHQYSKRKGSVYQLYAKEKGKKRGESAKGGGKRGERELLTTF